VEDRAGFALGSWDKAVLLQAGRPAVFALFSDSLVLRPRVVACPARHGQTDEPQPRLHGCSCWHTAASVQTLPTIASRDIRTSERDESPWLGPGASLAGRAELPGHERCLWSPAWAEGQGLQKWQWPRHPRPPHQHRVLGRKVVTRV